MKTKNKWVLARRSSRGLNDGVEVTKSGGLFSIYRYIDDWDEDGDTIYAINEYLKGIPEQQIKQAIPAESDDEVASWIKSHLIKEESNSLDAIEAFLKEKNVPYTYEER